MPKPVTESAAGDRDPFADKNPAAGDDIAGRLYRDCVEHSPYGVLMHDPKGLILLFNPQLETLTGYTREEIPDIPTWIAKLYPDPAYRRILVELRGTGPREGQVRIREALITRKDGQRRMCQFTLAALSDGTRIIFIRDIHDTAEFIGGRSLVSPDGLQIHPRSLMPVFGWVHCGGEFLLAGFNQAAAELAGERLAASLAAGAVEFYAEAPEMVEDIRRCFAQRGSLRRVRPLAFPQATEPRTYEVTFAFSPPCYVFVYLKDLTDLIRTQAQLVDSEAQFAEFANILPEVVFETDCAGKITFLNQKGIEDLGYTKENFPERPSAFEFLEPADRPRAEANFRRVMAGEYLGPNEYRARSRHGLTIPILLMSCRIERQGALAGTRGFIVDMTAHNEAAQALKVSEERLRMAAEGARIALWDWNLKTGEAYCNEEYFRILGYDPGEFTPSYEKWLELLHPEDRKRAGGRAQKVLIEGRGAPLAYSDEYRMRAKDGTWRWIQDFGRVVERDADGAPRRALGIHIDITERKKSEEALRASEQKFAATFHAGAGAAAIVSMEEGIFLEVNQGICEMTGYDRQELIGRSVYDLGIWVDPDERRRLIRLVADQGLVRNHEFSFRRKSGEARQGLISATVISMQGRPCLLSEAVDLTERRQAEQALQLSEERLRLATEGSSIGMWDWHAQTGVIHCNDIYFTMLGYAPGEFVQSPARWEEMVHPEDRERAVASVEAAKSGRSEAYSEEYRIRCKDGSYLWISDSGRIVERGADGSALRAIGIHIDITERRRSEETLRASEEKFSRAFHASPGGFAITTVAEGRYIDANLAECEMTGYRREELIGRSIFYLGIWADPADGRRLRRLLEETGVVRNFPYRFRRKSGEIRQGLISAALVEIDGERCLVSEAQDLTEQLKAEQALRVSEERLRMATEGANIGLWDWDLKTGEVFCNEQYFRMLGYDAEVMQPSFEWWRERIHPEDRGRAERHAQERLVEGKGPFSIEYRMPAKDGSWRWIHDLGHVVERDPEGKPARALGIHRDVTDRKRADEALKLANDELERRVAKRTEALVASNRKLKQQVTRRLAAEKKLRAQEKQLKRKSADLMEVNSALKVLLKKREEDRQEVEEMIGTHLKELVMPYLEKLKRGRLSARHQAYVGVIESNLKDVASPFAKVLSDKMYSFTPTEIQVANFIKLDKSNKEIAGYLNLSVKTIEYHRYNIRRKLELIGKPVNLRSYLKTMS